jgi:hypothetical protein
MNTMTVRQSSDGLTYTYRIREYDPLHIVRRPDFGFTDQEWVSHLYGMRLRVFRMANHHEPAFENLKACGRPVRIPGKHTSRHAEIAGALARLVAGCKPDDAPFIIDR